MVFLHLFFTNVNEYNRDSAFRTLVTILSYMILIYNILTLCQWTKHFVQSVFKSNLNFLRGISFTLKILKWLRLDKIETYDQYLKKKIGIENLALYVPVNNLKALILDPSDSPSESISNHNNIIEARFNHLLYTNSNQIDDRQQQQGATNRRMLSTRGALYSVNDSNEQAIERRQHARKKKKNNSSVSSKSRIFQDESRVF
jgi:hypothetical protein